MGWTRNGPRAGRLIVSTGSSDPRLLHNGAARKSCQSPAHDAHTSNTNVPSHDNDTLRSERDYDLRMPTDVLIRPDEKYHPCQKILSLPRPAWTQ